MNYTRRSFIKTVVKTITIMGIPAYKIREAIAAPSELNFGIITSFTGPFAQYGKEGVKGAQLAIDEINSTGGIRGIRANVVVRDDSGAAHKGRVGFEMLANENNTIALIGANIVQYDKKLSELAELYEVPYFIINPFRRTWYRKGLKYTFRIAPEVSVMATQAVSYLKEISNQKNVPIKKIGILRSFSKTWDEAEEEIIAASRKENLSIAFNRSVPLFNQDVRSFIQKVVRIPTDVVFLATSIPFIIKTVAETVREIPYKPKAIVGFFSVLANSFYVAENRNLFLNLMDANYWGDPKRDEVKIFQNRFRQRFNVYPSNDAYAAYTAIMIVKHAIEKSKSIDKIKFTAFMRDNKLPRFLLAQNDGIKFDKQGRNVNAETLLLQVSNPRPIPIYPENFAESRPVFPM